MPEVNIDQLREEVAAAAREINRRGLVNPGEGNVSMRVGKATEMLITPSYNQYATLTAEEIVHMNFDGTQISQGRPASTEYKLHRAIYEDRDKVKCVIHTHSPYASALSILHKNLPVLMEEMVAFLGGEVQCAEFGAAHSENLPAKALAGLGQNNAVLLANHGVLVCGRDAEYCVNIATLVEKMSRVYLVALQAGEPNIIPDENLGKFHMYFDARATYSRKKKKAVVRYKDIKDMATAWANEYAEALNNSEAYGRAAKKWGVDFDGSMLFVYLPSGELTDEFSVFLDLAEGKCLSTTVLGPGEEPPRVPTMRISAPMSKWKRVIFREVDPVSALMQGILTLEGDMSLAMRFSQAAIELVNATEQTDRTLFTQYDYGK